MRIRSLLFTSILIGLHYLASVLAVMTQLACSPKAALPSPSAWSCSMGGMLEWALLTPVLALPDLFPGLELAVGTLAIGALFNSALQVLLLEASVEVSKLASGKLARPARARARAPMVPPPFATDRPATPPPFGHALRRQRAP